MPGSSVTGTYLQDTQTPSISREAKLADAQIWSTKLDLKSIDHAVNVGAELRYHAGFPSHAQNVPQWKEFTETLLKHGFTEEETSKILGENVQRILRETL